MWYRVDFVKLAVQLLPPVLRKRTLAALLGAMAAPVRSAHSDFTAYREYVAGRLGTTANTASLEKALNGAFFLDGSPIRVETPDAAGETPWHLKKEGREGVFLHREGGSPAVMKHKGEADYGESFVVRVPSFLGTSPDASEDKHGGRHLRTIRTLLDYYKPAGRTFRIEIYDYE